MINGLIKYGEKLLKRRHEKDAEFLSKEGREDRLKMDVESMVNGDKNPDNLLVFKKLIRSIGIVRDPSYRCGTIFITKVSGVGLCLLSAGHNFQTILEDFSVQRIMSILNNFRVRFGDIDGNIPDDSPAEELKCGEPMSLKIFFEEFCVGGSIQYKGKRTIFKMKNNQLDTDFQDKLEEDSDYCAILLHDNIEKRLDELGLAFLDCGIGQQLEHKENSPVMIIGYPEREEPKGSNKYPQRPSYGLEKEISYARTKISCNYDSLPGNSGSPVFGDHYKVKGIHVWGDQLRVGTNYMQKITDIKSWIDLGVKPRQ